MLQSAWEMVREAGDLRSRARLLGYLLGQRTGLRARGGIVRLHLAGIDLVISPGNGELALFREIFLQRVYEAHPAFVWRPGWQVLDLGANIGIFSLRAALVGSAARIVSVEPAPDTFQRLIVNLHVNGATQVTPVRAAVGASCGVGCLAHDAPSTLRHLRPAGRTEDGAIDVEVITVDALAAREGLDHVDLIKVDVEGGELNVLEGAAETLTRCDRVVLELHGTREAVRQLLDARGFALVKALGASHDFFVRRDARLI